MDSRKELALEFLDHRPAAAARVLEQQTVEQSVALLSELPARIVSTVIANMLPHYASQCLAAFSVEHAAGVLQQLSTHRGAALLRGLSQKRRDSILAQLSQIKTSSLRFLLGQGHNVVGGWVDQHAFTLRPELTVAQARQRLQQWQRFEAQRLFLIDQDNNLLGAVSMTRLIQADDQQRIGDLAEPSKSLRIRTSLFAAEQHKDWLNFVEMPVIGRHDEYVGIMTYKLLTRGLRSLRQVPREQAQENNDAINTLADVFMNSFTSTWQTWSDLLSLPAEQQGVEDAKLSGRNRNA